MQHHTHKLLFVGAKTGGHIFPGLAIAQHWQAGGGSVVWLGAGYPLEAEWVAQRSRIPLYNIAFDGLRGRGWKGAVRGLLQLPLAIARCFALLKREKPDAIVLLGGFIGLPIALAAWFRRRPFVVLNADSTPLLSTRLVRPLAREIWFGLGQQGLVIGNPVRHEILALPPPATRYRNRTGHLNVLVLGGSTGAHALNTSLPPLLKRFCQSQGPCRITHQSGRADAAMVAASYAQLGLEAQVAPFINDMAHAYAEADLVICRSGAITVSELTAVGVAAILLPLQASSTSHQLANARWLEAEGAALLWQRDTHDNKRHQDLQSLNREGCLALAEKAYQLGRRDVLTAIETRLLSLLPRR